MGTRTLLGSTSASWARSRISVRRAINRQCVQDASSMQIHEVVPSLSSLPFASLCTASFATPSITAYRCRPCLLRGDDKTSRTPATRAFDESNSIKRHYSTTFAPEVCDASPSCCSAPHSLGVVRMLAVEALNFLWILFVGVHHLVVRASVTSLPTFEPCIVCGNAHAHSLECPGRSRSHHRRK